MGRRKIRRRQHGSAWHWKQTDCWYYTMPGTKARVPLFDEAGERIRGREFIQHCQRRSRSGIAGELRTCCSRTARCCTVAAIEKLGGTVDYVNPAASEMFAVTYLRRCRHSSS